MAALRTKSQSKSPSTWETDMPIRPVLNLKFLVSVQCVNSLNFLFASASFSMKYSKRIPSRPMESFSIGTTVEGSI